MSDRLREIDKSIKRQCILYWSGIVLVAAYILAVLSCNCRSAEVHVYGFQGCPACASLKAALRIDPLRSVASGATLVFHESIQEGTAAGVTLYPTIIVPGVKQPLVGFWGQVGTSAWLRDAIAIADRPKALNTAPPLPPCIWEITETVRAWSDDSDVVIKAGRAIGVRSLSSGVCHPVLQRAAERRAQRQAAENRQSHDGWDAAYHEFQQAMPGYSGFQEICAESWPWDTRESAGPEMFKSWKQSPGHWSVADGNCAAFGYSMAKGSNGVWYGTGIVGQR